MTPLRILITNIQLSHRTGTETYVRDLALRLKARGHHPVVYSPELGEIASEIQGAGIQVIGDLERLTAVPDVIHGHHHPTTMAALVSCPTVPGLFVVHDRYGWHDEPPRHPRLLRYVAVDDCCRERLDEARLPKKACIVLNNAVDLDRFAPRRAPLPHRPEKALIFSSYARHDNYAAAIFTACNHAGLHVDAAGEAIGRLVRAPEDVLPAYDLVFARGRCALEALAVGCAVVVCGSEGTGGMVTPDNYARFRRLNFGRGLMTQPVDAESIAREIGQYDAMAQPSIAARARNDGDLEALVDDLVGAYRKIMAEAAGKDPPSPREESRAIVDYLSLVTRQLGGPAAAPGAPAATITASSMLENLSAAGLLRAVQPGWHAARNPTYPQWVQIVLDEPRTVRRISLLPQDGFAERGPKKVQVEGRQDGTTWTPLLTIEDARGSENSWRSFDLEAPRTLRELRLVIHSNCGDPNLLTLRGVKLE